MNVDDAKLILAVIAAGVAAIIGAVVILWKWLRKK